MKKEKKPYNLTDLDPETVFERHVFHRDQFAHYLRWVHVLKCAKIGETVVDFGCGNGNLLQVLYRNRFAAKAYLGFDIRQQTIAQANKKYMPVKWAQFHVADLLMTDELDGGYDWSSLNADKVVSFEVAEHVGAQHLDLFLRNFKACGHKDATYFLSTPCHDPKVGAAGNHTYDADDGRGVAVQEHTQAALLTALREHFVVTEMYGTFASVRDYKPLMNSWQGRMYEELGRYYDANLLSNLMAPMFPEASRNCLYVLKLHGEELPLVDIIIKGLGDGYGEEIARVKLDDTKTDAKDETWNNTLMVYDIPADFLKDDDEDFDL